MGVLQVMDHSCEVYYLFWVPLIENLEPYRWFYQQEVFEVTAIPTSREAWDCCYRYSLYLSKLQPKDTENKLGNINTSRSEDATHYSMMFDWLGAMVLMATNLSMSPPYQAPFFLPEEPNPPPTIYGWPATHHGDNHNILGLDAPSSKIHALTTPNIKQHRGVRK